jgi:DNA-binding MarR family transcriptional regulator
MDKLAKEELLPIPVVFESIFDIVSYFAEYFKPAVKIRDLKTSELYILLYLFLKGRKNMNQLSRFLNTTKSNMTSLIDNMEKEGLLKREHSKEDRRIIDVKLTTKGTRLGKSTLSNFNDLVQEFFKKVKAEDYPIIAQGFSLLHRLTVSDDSGV